MQSHRITHITFDFFGTLVGYPSDRLLGLQYPKAYDFFCKKGIIIPYETFVSLFDQKYISMTKNEQMDEFHMYDMVRLFSKDLGVILRENELHSVTHTFLDEWNINVAHIDELVPILERLYKKYTLAIISNTNFADMVHRNLKSMGTQHLFSLIMTSVAHGKRKPHQKIFTDTIVALKANPENVLHVGDSYMADYLGAKNAGMKALLIDEKKDYTGKVPERVDSILLIEEYLQTV